MSNQESNYSKKYVKSLKILTPREVEVLHKVAEGNTSPEIAQELHVSKKTVGKHRENICQKLDIEGYRGLFHWCQEFAPNS